MLLEIHRGLLPALVCSTLACATPRTQVPWPNLDVPAVAVHGGERDAAVIVALQDYAFVPMVPGAVDNGRAWQRYFTSTLGVPSTHVALLTNQYATKESIEAKLDWAAARARAGGRVWFVFIGHGAASRSGQDSLLLGVDAQANADRLESRSLRHSDVIARLESSLAQPVLVLDACYSGRTSAELPRPERAIVLSADRSHRIAQSLPGRAQPAFSYLALGALRGWADGDGDGSVTAWEVIDYTNAVFYALGRPQAPEMLGNGGFALARSARERGPRSSEIRRMSNKEFNRHGIVLPNELIAAMRHDWNQAVLPLLNDDIRSVAENRKMVRAFLETYEMLGDMSEMQEALAAMKQLERGKAWHTPSVPIFIAGGSFDGHQIQSFYLDSTEVTVRAYWSCVDAAVCSPPDDLFRRRNCNQRSNKRYPVNCVLASQAEDYCAWVGGRLPTEWEWEWVVRRADRYWFLGYTESDRPGCSDRACSTGNCLVGRYSLDVTPDGIMDLAGNVSEWTSSMEDELVVARGGHHSCFHWPRAMDRVLMRPASSGPDVGFRCVRDP